MNLMLYRPSSMPDDESDARIRREEAQVQDQWKRDFEEGEEGIVGQLRERIRASKVAERLPPNGVDIQVRNLTYLSPPLHTQSESIVTYITRHLNLFRRLRNSVSPDPDRCRVLLDDLNFELPPRSMTLLIGSPGSGKVSVPCCVYISLEVKILTNHSPLCVVY